MPDFRLQNHEPALVRLDDLGIVRVQGADATSFLQGQLSNDLTRLAPERSLLAGYHNPQGRTIALVRLLWVGAEDFIAVLPRELTSVLATRLAKFVLRAKVKVTDQSTALRAFGIIGPESAAAALAAVGSATATAHARVADAPARWLIVVPAESSLSATADGDRNAWHRLDIQSGQAQVFAATSEEFVAQMLNLDALDAISFAKGCYTGQEVIARAHYRGRVKRRLQRFITAAPQTLSVGSSGTLADGRTFKVVDAVQLDDGRCEFLAVAPLPGPPIESAQPGAQDSAPSAAVPVDAQPLPLPYPLPE